MSRVIALVQARMGSTRFPEKMLVNLGEHPILEWVLRRSSKARLVDQVILATTDLIRDDALVALAQKLGFEVFRGSESDVLGRFATAAAIYKADAIVRICADNPFIDPDEIDRLVSHFRNNPCDYACNHQDRLGNRYADGFGAEILSNSLLQRIAQVAAEPRYREHATLYLWDHANEFCISAVPPPRDLAYPELRFDVDVTHDLTNLEWLITAGVDIDSTAFEIVQLALNRSRATLVTTDITYATANRDNTYFLGSWCFSSRHDERSAKNSGRIIPYHWDDRKKLKRDFDRLQELNDELLGELMVVLNQLHGVNEDKRFWRLMLGYWLNIYTTVVFDRWASLGQAKKSGITWKTEVHPIDVELLASNDTAEFIQKSSQSTLWNSSLFALLIQYIPEIQSIPVKVVFQENTPSKTPNTSLDFTKQLIKYVIRCGDNWLKYCDRLFLIGTYLPAKTLAKIEMSADQFPLPRFGIKGNNSFGFDVNSRQWTIPIDFAKDEFGIIARKLLPKLIPRIFIEGFSELMMQAEALPWPKSPAVIFTSNHHFADDVFKAWAARKIAHGTRLIIGEHGGFGVGLFNGAHSYEVSVADVYLSAGWSDTRNKNIVPIGNFRLAGKVLRAKPTGKALMVCVNMPRFTFDARSMAISSQILDYFEDQFIFIDSLPSNFRDQVVVRLYPLDYGWEQKERWLDHHPEISFGNGRLSMFKSLEECRLFIGTYSATTYVDTLALNFPTVIFWNPERWEIKNEAKPYFVALKEAGIFHESPQSAARQVACIWDNIPGWWESEAVQSARRAFCDNYSAIPADLVGRLNQVLLDEANRSTIPA